MIDWTKDICLHYGDQKYAAKVLTDQTSHNPKFPKVIQIQFDSITFGKDYANEQGHLLIRGAQETLNENTSFYARIENVKSVKQRDNKFTNRVPWFLKDKNND